jgi:DNA-3-methyladenine glycosylase II
MNIAEFSIKGPYDFRKSLRFSQKCLFENNPNIQDSYLQRAIAMDGHAVVINIACSDDIEKPVARVQWESLGGNNINPQDVVDFTKRILLADLALENFYQVASNSKQLKPLIEKFRGLKPVLTSTIFEAAVWAIMGQQINLNFANILKTRLVQKYGEKIAQDGNNWTLFPTSNKMSRLRVSSLRKLQLSARKAEYLTGLASAVSAGRLSLEKLSELSYQDSLEELLSIRGIGPWSANYILMRGAGHLDALPIGDSGLHKAALNLYKIREYPDSDKIERLAQPFRPYRSLFTLYLWYSLLNKE